MGGPLRTERARGPSREGGAMSGVVGRRAVGTGLLLLALCATGCLRQSHIAYRGDPVNRVQYASLVSSPPVPPQVSADPLRAKRGIPW